MIAKMKCLTGVILTLTCAVFVNSAEIKINEEFHDFADKIAVLRNLHLSEMKQIKKEIEDLK